MPGPLDGIVVMDFTQLVQGPYASQILADLGAEVVKVEPPAGDWLRRFALGNNFPGGESISFLAFNRNKSSIVLNLKRKDHAEVARRMIADADVLLENFRPGVMERLGLGYETLKVLNPALVYCSSTGYGPDGPYRERPGQDLLIQAVAGLPTLNGREGDPPVPVAVGISDMVAGLHMVYATLAALLERDRGSGLGQRVEVNLLNSVLALQTQELTAHLNTDARPRRNTTMAGSPYTGAPFGIYATADGHIALAMNRVDNLMELLGVEGWDGLAEQNVTDPEQDTAIRAALCERFATQPTSELLELLLGADVWCSPLNDYDGVIADPQVQHNGMVVDVDHSSAGTIRVIGIPTAFSRSKPSIRSAPPRLGENSREILVRAGFSDSEIEGVLSSAPTSAE